MTPDEVERLEKRIDGLQSIMLTMVGEISSLKALVHSPGNCDLKENVRDLELQNARNKGILVTIGFFVTAVSATIGGLIVKFWK